MKRRSYPCCPACGYRWTQQPTNPKSRCPQCQKLWTRAELGSYEMFAAERKSTGAPKETLDRGEKRRRCGGHGYTGGDGFKEID